MQTSRKESNHFANFYLAGFTYYDGIKVFNHLKVGTKLSLVAEPDNPYDAKAVAIYLGESKIGFVPRGDNRAISKFLNLGYQDIFEAYINRVSPDEYPENQIGIVVKIKELNS